MPMLVKDVILRYQFETYHPFFDGNCRIRRILNTLFLIEKEVPTKPLLYLSCYLRGENSVIR